MPSWITNISNPITLIAFALALVFGFMSRPKSPRWWPPMAMGLAVIGILGGLLIAVYVPSPKPLAKTARGQVTFFKHYELQLETGSHVYREVHLHKGTVINPHGTTLLKGQTVQIAGVAQSDGSLTADVIEVVKK